MDRYDLETLDGSEQLSLCETLDRVLNKGVVVVGEVVISVANIDLIYLGLQVLLSSVETASHLQDGRALRIATAAGEGT
jgi:hypothetical protein